MTSISIEQIIKIFENYKIGKKINTNFGDGIEVSEQTAFLLSSHTDTAYINNNFYPLNLFNQFKCFNDIECNKIDAGLFNNQNLIELKNNYHNLNEKYPFLFKGKKIVLPLIINNHDEYKKILSDIINKEIKPENFLILKIDGAKKDGGIENLLEFFASIFFKFKNYISFTQLSLKHSYGIPDIVLFNNFLNNKGFFLLELAFLNFFNIKINNINGIEKIYAGEAKSNSSIDTTPRLKKYEDLMMFDSLFAIYPDNKSYEKIIKKYNIFFVNDDELNYIEKNSSFKIDYNKKIKLINYLITTTKLLLLSNLNKKQLDDFLKQNSLKKDDTKRFVSLINKINLKNIADVIIGSDN